MCTSVEQPTPGLTTPDGAVLEGGHSIHQPAPPFPTYSPLYLGQPSKRKLITLPLSLRPVRGLRWCGTTGGASGASSTRSGARRGRRTFRA